MKYLTVVTSSKPFSLVFAYKPKMSFTPNLILVLWFAVRESGVLIADEFICKSIYITSIN